MVASKNRPGSRFQPGPGRDFAGTGTITGTGTVTVTGTVTGTGTEKFSKFPEFPKIF